jgi:hypothetical protein
VGCDVERQAETSAHKLENLGSYCALPTWVAQHKVKLVAQSVTRMSYDDLQLTCQIPISMVEVGKLIICVSNDFMILERDKSIKIISRRFQVF